LRDEDDGSLVARAVDGDRRALEVLLDRHADRIHAVCRRVVAHPEDALDATQEAMIAIARGITRFDGRAAFSTWCYRIATKEISYGIIAPYVQWDDAPVDVTADQAIAQAAATRRGGSSLAEAKDFLRDLLDDGPVDAKSVLEDAKKNGISERTLDRAKSDLKIKSAKDEGSLDGIWKWRLP